MNYKPSKGFKIVLIIIGSIILGVIVFSMIAAYMMKNDLQPGWPL